MERWKPTQKENRMLIKGNTDGKQAASPRRMPGSLEIQKAVIWMLIKKHWHTPYHPGRQLLLSCYYRDGRFILGEIKEKSYKIRNSGYNWDRAKSWMENTGVMWKCAHCIVNLQLPSYVQVLEVWQPGIRYLDSHSLSMKSSLASEGKKNVQVQSFENYFSESNINLLGHASVHPTRQQVLPML